LAPQPGIDTRSRQPVEQQGPTESGRGCRQRNAFTRNLRGRHRLSLESARGITRIGAGK
jgi:hypothetical protein